MLHYVRYGIARIMIANLARYYDSISPPLRRLASGMKVKSHGNTGCRISISNAKRTNDEHMRPT